MSADFRRHLVGKTLINVCKPAVADLLLLPRPAGDTNRLLHGAQQRGVRRANAGSATLSAYAGSCDTDLFANIYSIRHTILGDKIDKRCAAVSQ